MKVKAVAALLVNCSPALRACVEDDSYAEQRLGGPLPDLDAVESFIAEKEAKGA